MEDLITQWAISAGMILAGIVAALLVGWIVWIIAGLLLAWIVWAIRAPV